MPRNTVIWDELPTTELTVFWLQATERQAIADASNQIDIFLKYFPEKGEKVGDYFHLNMPPLVVEYRYSPDDRMVKVTRIKLIG